MKNSETLTMLADSMAPTVGNRIISRLLLELADEVENLEFERDDAIEEALRMREILEDGGL